MTLQRDLPRSTPKFPSRAAIALLLALLGMVLTVWGFLAGINAALDGSAKGGFVIAVQEKTGIPIKLIGPGEGIGDLTGFSPQVFVQNLVG